jgi:hypothetical protein
VLPVFEVLTYLPYVPDAVLLVVGIAVLWRCRRRSRRAVTLALAALFGFGGLWLFAIGFHLVWDFWKEVPVNAIPVAIHVYSLLMRTLEAACILLLVLAVVTDRPAPGQDRRTDLGPEADFDDAPSVPPRASERSRFSSPPR